MDEDIEGVDGMDEDIEGVDGMDEYRDVALGSSMGSLVVTG
jgi:hypothetical protein